MLIANNLSFERSGKTIFKGLEFSLSPGKVLQIRGRNGVGKTTLIKILSYILIPTTGDIYWEGKNIRKYSENYFKNFTLIMDNNSSKKNMTVNENITFWKNLFCSTISKDEIDHLLKALNIYKYKEMLVQNLSYGEKRKLEISRLIIEKKKLWIFDEPYLGLDDITIETFNETLKKHIQNKGMVIFSSHYHLEMYGVNTINLENFSTV